MRSRLSLVRSRISNYDVSHSQVSDDGIGFGSSSIPKDISISKEVWDIHVEALNVARDIKSCETRLLEVLRKLDDTHGYREFKCQSLYAYCVDVMKLTESVSLNWIAIMRRGKDVPELVTAVNDGRISVSAARKITGVITSENKDAWLSFAENSSVQQVEKAVAIASPREAVRESMKYVTGERLPLTLGVSEEWKSHLSKLKDLLSQKCQRSIDSEEALLIVMGDYILRNDPLEKAKRSAARSEVRANRKEKVERVEPHVSRHAQQFGPVCKSIKHAVLLRDAHQCTEPSFDGNRCSEKRWLDLHHIVPRSRGGTNNPENLRTVCRAHHREIHRLNH
jgi:5-methylcytosine-specific restriction endonuclease McrA